METVTFQSIFLENVGCHNQMEIEFKNNCLIGIIGENGSGKSTIFKSLMVGLFGQTGERGNNLTIDDLVNRKHKKDLSIIVKFLIDDTPYEIRKYQNHTKFKNQTILLRDGENISGKSVTETHEKVETLLSPIDIFRNTIYFSQQIKDFFTALTNADQWRIFNAIFSLDEWYERLAFCTENLKQITSEYDQYKSKRDKVAVEIPERKKYYNRLAQIKDTEVQVHESDVANVIKLRDDANNEKGDCEIRLVEISFDEKKYLDINSQFTILQNKIETINSEIDSEIEVIKSEKESAIEKLKLEARIKFEEKKREVEEKEQKTIDLIIASISDFKKSTESKIKTIDSNLEKMYKQKDIILVKMRKNLNSLSELMGSFNFKIMNAQGAIQEQTKSKNLMIKEKQSIIDNEIDICDKCGQTIKGKSKKKVIDELTQKIDLCEEIIEKANKILEENQTNLDEAQSHHDALWSDISDTENIFDTDIRNLIDSKNELIEMQNDYIAEQEENLKKINALIYENISQAKDSITIEFKQKINEHIINADRIVHEKEDEKEKRKSDIVIELEKVRKMRFSLEKDKDLFYNTKSRIESLQSEYERCCSLLAELEKFEFDDLEIVLCKQQNTQLELDYKILINKLSEYKELIDMLEFWKEAFSDRGIKSMLIDGAIPFLNACVREELERLVPGKFILSFDTMSQTKAGQVRDKFSVNVLNTVTGADSHKLLSGGEKRIIDVCTLVGLRRLTESIHHKKYNILLLDEVLDSLDKKNSSQYLQILKKLSDDLSICVVTHNDNVSAYCDEAYQL